MKIGIIGIGFVGGAVLNSYDRFNVELVTIDSDSTRGTGTYADLHDADGVFVCVPSPVGEGGFCDTSILESVLLKLKEVNFQNVIISKVTAPPDVYTRLQNLYPNLVYSPEFLTAANANNDYLMSSCVIIGGKYSTFKVAAKTIIYESNLSTNNYVYCSIEEASLTKYVINCFLATKVVFMNEIKQLADMVGIDYNKVEKLVQEDYRIGESHTKVPGPDGSLGFGGACFPKDTSALLAYANSIGFNPNVLDAAVKKNLMLRLTDPK